MVIVNALDSVTAIIKADKELANEPSSDEIQKYLIGLGEGEMVQYDTPFID